MEARQSSKFVPNEVSPRFRRALKSGSRSVRALVFHGVLLGSVLFAGVATPRLWGATPDNPSSFRVSKLDTYLLDDISRRSFRYFWEQTDPHTGLVMDRALVTGKPDDDPRHRNVASIAATGFGLTADCIAAQHRWISPEVARQRILTTLRFFAEKAPREHGWFFHFLDAKTGERRWDSEVSSIDTALLLAGILTTQQAFANDPEIVRLSTLIYDRVDFPWMLNGSRVFLSHGWKPETGFLPYRWDTYSEAKILYTLAIGSPTHPISPDAWHAWKLPIVDDAGYTFIGGGPLFTPSTHRPGWTCATTSMLETRSWTDSFHTSTSSPMQWRLRARNGRLRSTSRNISPVIPQTYGGSPHRTARMVTSPGATCLATHASMERWCPARLRVR